MTDTNIRLAAVVLDCPDTRALAAFYASLLAGKVAASSDETWAELEPPHQLLHFQRVDDYIPPSWPDGGPQQFHLDLVVDNIVATHAAVVEAGATPLDPVDPPASDHTRHFRVYADPAGHPFCLCGGTSAMSQ